MQDLDKATHGTTLIVDHTGKVVYDSERKLLAENLESTGMLQRASGEYLIAHLILQVLSVRFIAPILAQDATGSIANVTVVL